MENQHRQIILMIILSFLLNLLWEVAHSMLYNWNKLPLQNNVYFYVPRILSATLGDLTILTLILIGVTLINKNLKWINAPSKADYFVITLGAIVIAIIIEIRGVYFFGRWSYNEFMPTIFGIGLSPLVQLAITTLIVIWLVRR